MDPSYVRMQNLNFEVPRPTRRGFFPKNMKELSSFNGSDLSQFFLINPTVHLSFLYSTYYH